MAALRLLSAIGGLALTIVAAACAAPTPIPTLAPEPTAYERVTEELLPGMQWGELEPGLERYVRSCGSSARCTGALAASAPGESGRFIDDAARERGEALAELAAEAFMGDDDNLYLRWRKIEDRATGAKRELTEEEFAALPPREQALHNWYEIIRWEDDDLREFFY